jgi:uncharacterized membrane protein YedE/YeeE
MKSFIYLLSALACGLLFGFGLSLSGMLDPARVRGFLDIFGDWDPSLAFVLGGAVVASFAGFRLSRRRRAPLLAPRYDLPSNSKVDAPLVLGSAIFGVGWGIAGLCPGPAVASLALGLWPSFVFTLAMIVGMALFRFFTKVSAPADAPSVARRAAE